jgi:hypothetical protein
MEDLQEKVKRFTWRGRPTKKYRRLLQIQARLEGYYRALDAAGELGPKK